MSDDITTRARVLLRKFSKRMRRAMTVGTDGQRLHLCTIATSRALWRRDCVGGDYRTLTDLGREVHRLAAAEPSRVTKDGEG